MNLNALNDIKGKIQRDKKKKGLNVIKSLYFIRKVFNHLYKKKTLEILKYNKRMQNILQLNMNDYKDYHEQVEILIRPTINKYGKFINIPKREQKAFYHIFFENNNNKEIKRDYLKANEKISKIKLIIENMVDSFMLLFDKCDCIESIIFLKFYRNNIHDMSYMFNECLSLKEIHFSNFITDNVTNMACMFFSCESLKELNLSKFKTNKVNDMSNIFQGCSLLKH